ncbi:hypothetical protein [Streptomyces sp. NPDC088794]|uniref:hypothetical protein n=1 Tax=Streptomyces sp. NPDC088794 TaxID=3365902 RepID=UPI0037FE6C85
MGGAEESRKETQCGSSSTNGALGIDESAGGFCSGTDVDAFTFKDKAYYVTWDNIENYRIVPAGTWTKVTNAERTTCSSYESVITCAVS